jgi:hypothetical protein
MQRSSSKGGRHSIATAAIMILVLGMTTHGQWINHPTATIPRTPDGKPDVNAPSPRSADGHIDLSGIWTRVAPLRPPSLLPEPSDLADYVVNGSAIEMTPRAADVFRGIVAADGAGHPSETCLPKTFPNQIVLPLPIQIVQSPGITFILFEEFNHFRQILTDGRAHPADLNPTWFGYSVGSWQGDTFVVDTRGFRDGLWLDGRGHTATDRLRTIERWTRKDMGHLRLQLTIDDPGAYTRPWTTEVQLTLVPDTTLLEYVCENEKFGAQSLRRAVNGR